MTVAVIGAGWAGMAAAIAHVQAGRTVVLFEAARTPGGRARALTRAAPGGTAPLRLDNGQHILIGAYGECLRLMRLVGVDLERALLRLPFALRFPDGQGLQFPALAPPLDALAAIARARGWRWRDKLALLRSAAAWRMRGFSCAPQTSVAQLCAALPQRLMADLLDPLCVSALNTPAQAASGQVFLRVLQDSLFAGRGGSDLLLPRTDLGALFPQPAARWLAQRGAQLHTGQRVQALRALAGGGWQLDCRGTGTGNDGAAAAGARFSQITLACPPGEARRLVATASGLDAAGQRAARSWCAHAAALRFGAITTVYAHAPGARLALPMLALRSRSGAPAQFVFDRGQLDGQHGLLAFVVSASDAAHERAAIEAQVLQQGRAQLALPALRAVQTVVEKRASFVCTPGLQRPGSQILPGLCACGDYVQGPYPATLEGAVRSAALALA